MSFALRLRRTHIHPAGDTPRDAASCGADHLLLGAIHDAAPRGGDHLLGRGPVSNCACLLRLLCIWAIVYSAVILFVWPAVGLLRGRSSVCVLAGVVPYVRGLRCDVSLGCTCGERQVGGWGLGGEVGMACVVYWPFRFDSLTANLIDAGVNDRPRWGCIVSTPRRMYMQLSR